MQRYRLEWVADGRLEAVNQLLVRGWRPVRELPVSASSSEAGPQADLLVVLERDDEFPIFSGELLRDGVPLESLQDMAIFRGMTGPELRELVAACEVRRYAAETVLFDEQQTDRRMYVLLEGKVSIQLLGLMIDDPIILEAGPQDTFGEASLFAPSAHTTRATTSTAVTALELTGTAFDDLFQACRPVACKLALNGAALLADRLRATDAWVREMLQGDKSTDAIRSWRRFRHSLSSRVNRPKEGGFIHIT